MATAPFTLGSQYTSGQLGDSGNLLPPSRTPFVHNTFIQVSAVDADDDYEMPLGRSKSAPAIVTLSSTPPPATLRGLVGGGGDEEPTGSGNDVQLPPESRAWANNPRACPQEKTTLMVRNLPYLLSRSTFLHMLDSNGLRGDYDLVYFPRDLSMSACQGLGYAFVNLSGGQTAVDKFREVFQGRSNWPMPGLATPKIGQVSWAKRQGLKKNIEYFKNSSVLLDPSVREDCKPILFKQGLPVDFPAPTSKKNPAAQCWRLGRPRGCLRAS